MVLAGATHQLIKSFSSGYVEHFCQRASDQKIEIKFVSGGCAKGADHFIAEICKESNLKLTEHLPVFNEGMAYYDRVKAYYARNRLIAEDADILLAMVAPDRTRGHRINNKVRQGVK